MRGRETSLLEGTETGEWREGGREGGREGERERERKVFLLQKLQLILC